MLSFLFNKTLRVLMFNFKWSNLVKYLIMKKLLPLYFFAAFFFYTKSFAQEEKSSGHHQTLGISISHVNIFNGVDNGVDNSETKLISLPAWGIDYITGLTKNGVWDFIPISRSINLL